MKAVNAAGTGVASSLISILAATVPSAPDPPTVTFQNEQTISIAWTMPSDNGSDVLQSYSVYWDQGLGESSYMALGSTDTFTLSFTKSTGLTTGTAYGFKVTASNSIGESQKSSPARTVFAAKVPDAP